MGRRSLEYYLPCLGSGKHGGEMANMSWSVLARKTAVNLTFPIPGLVEGKKNDSLPPVFPLPLPLSMQTPLHAGEPTYNAPRLVSH